MRVLGSRLRSSCRGAVSPVPVCPWHPGTLTPPAFWCSTSWSPQELAGPETTGSLLTGPHVVVAQGPGGPWAASAFSQITFPSTLGSEQQESHKSVPVPVPPRPGLPTAPSWLTPSPGPGRSPLLLGERCPPSQACLSVFPPSLSAIPSCPASPGRPRVSSLLAHDTAIRLSSWGLPHLPPDTLLLVWQ